MGLLRQPTSDITKGVIWKQLLAFFFPLWFGTFFQQLYNTVDTLVVGRALILNDRIIKVNHNICVLVQCISCHNTEPDNDSDQPLYDIFQDYLMLLQHTVHI